MFRLWLGALLAIALSLPATAQVQPYPANFRTQEIQTNSTTIHVRVGGQGPAVVLLHGYGETGDMWAPLAAELARDHTVVAPDLRGMGLSSRPEISRPVLERVLGGSEVVQRSLSRTLRTALRAAGRDAR